MIQSSRSIEESQDIGNKDENNTNVQDSQIGGVDSEDENIPLPRTAQNSVPQYPDLDPSLRRTSECLRNLQEAERARIQKSKSKVADAAKANQSGEGVMMFGQDKQQNA